MTDWALVTDGVVENIIVVADGDSEFAHAYVAQGDNGFQQAVALPEEHDVGIGDTIDSPSSTGET